MEDAHYVLVLSIIDFGSCYAHGQHQNVCEHLQTHLRYENKQPKKKKQAIQNPLFTLTCNAPRENLLCMWRAP
jgi:hypothetical protein